MSWLATKYAWKCEDERVKGSVRLVLLAVALRTRRARITTLPTSLVQLQRLTLLSQEQIRRCLDTLETLGLVRRLNRGKNAVYGLPGMAGPLFAVQSEEEPVKMTDFQLPGRPRETVQHDRFSAVRMPGKNRAFPGRRAGGVFSSSDLGTKQLATTTSGDDEVAAEALLTWCDRECPQHRGGVRFHIHNRQRGVTAITDLMRGRSIERVKAILVRGWTDTGDSWLTASDRSLFAILNKVAYLEARVIELEATNHRALAPAQSAEERYRASCDRVVKLLREHTDEPLASACASVADALMSDKEPNLEALGQILMEAARPMCDLAAMETMAAESLAQFKTRMTPDAYQNALMLATDAMVAKHLRLPDLSALSAAAVHNEARK